MKALNVHAPSALLTPFLIDHTSSAAQQATERGWRGPAARPVATRSVGLAGRWWGAGCAVGGLGAARTVRRGDDAGARVEPVEAGEARTRAAAV